MRRSVAVAGALFAALGAVAACGALHDEDSTGDAVASVVTAVPDAVPAVADAMPAVASPTAVVDDVALADRAREIIRPTCGTCHTTSSPLAVPKALAVYDLDRPDWGATMNRARLAKFSKRIAGKQDFTDADRAALDEYVQVLLARAAD